MMKKRFLISGLVICMVGFWSGCGDNRTIVSESEVSMANPFVDCDSMEEGGEIGWIPVEGSGESGRLW